MTEMINVSGEEMVDVNIEDMSSINLDDLMADVVEVQAILQCNSVGQMIDVNEIYEKLEELAFIDRGQRIEYVATQLLHKMGVIDDPEVSPEERVFRFSQRGSEDSLAADSSSSDERSPVSEASGSGGTQTENSVPFSNEIVTGCSRKDDVTVKCVSVPSAEILALVNNENKNSEDCNIKIQQDPFHKFDADDKTLMNEAELIHGIIPHHDINQICACLEAYKDDAARVHIVIETFLNIDSESAVPQLPCAEIPLVSCNVESPMTSPTSDNGTPSCDENHDHDKYSQHNRSLEAPPANVIFPQETLADADLECGNFHNSELTYEQTCQEMDRNVGSGLIQTCNSVHDVTEQTNKLEMEVQHKDRRVHEGNIEVMPSALEQKELDVTSSSVEQNISEGSSENIQCSSYRDLVCQTDRESGDAVRDLTTSKPDENDMKLYISCNGVPSLLDEISTYNIEGNFDPNTSCETNASPPSCSVSQIEESQAVPATSTSPSSPQGAGIVESNTVQETHVELNDIGGEISWIMTDCEIVLPISSADGTETFENKSQSGTLVKVQPECDVTVTAVAEEQCSPSSEQSGTVVEEEHYESCDSTASDDLFNLMDVVYEEGAHDRIVAKLHELFPDARMDYLMRISQEYDSLTDMANKVLECSEQQNDHVDNTITMAVPSASALVPDSSASALAADSQSQGCRKKEITYEEFQSSLSHFAPELLMMVWEQIGNDYSKVKEFIAQHKPETLTNDQYHLLLGLFPHADAAFLRRKCNMIGNNEAALTDFIEEQLQTKTESQYHTLQAILPQLDSGFLRKKCDEFGDDEAAMRAFVAEHLQQNDVDDWYHSLLAMFPDTNPDVLRDIMNRIGDDTEAMRLFITQQLDEMEGVKFQTLLAVLPDADPDYLRDTFQSIGNDENSVKEFLLKALEKKDYPTREAYLKRQEMAALQRKYKEEFIIQDFIEMFPDPWKHFNEEDNNKGNELITRHGVAYLEARYKRIALDDIWSSFQKNKHNLTLTCSELDKWNGPVHPPRETYDCAVPKTEDIPVSFLQEVAFIENEERIKDFIDTQEQWKRGAFEMAKANGELLECQCCYDNEVMAEDMAACNEGHLFCTECIRRSAEIAIGNAQNGFACLTACTAEFSLKVLRTVLKPTVFSRMVQKKQLEEVQAAGIEDLENCPFCGFATIPHPDSTVFMCYNPECMRDSCRKCKRPNHIPQRCEEIESKEVKMRTFIEDRMTDALVRSCWKCERKFIKEAGCNKMTCTCGAHMCYICRQPVTNYSHFNGQGGTEFHKCPLYSDLEVIHDVAVQEEGIKAKKEIQAANPDVELKHDPTQARGEQK